MLFLSTKSQRKPCLSCLKCQATNLALVAGSLVLSSNHIPDSESTEQGDFMEDFMERIAPPNYQEDLMIRSIKAKMEELREENDNLKSLIARITKDHDALIVRINKARQVVAGKSHERSSPRDFRASDDDPDDHKQLVSLTLGRSSSTPKHNENENNEKFVGSYMCDQTIRKEEKSKNDHGPDLGLECMFDSRQADESLSNASEYFRMSKRREKYCNEGEKGKEKKQTLVADDQEEAIAAKLKKARVSIKARCVTPVINDGCQWRKYGQKTAKGNPCPRAYYRCTLSPSCPVRKQVQRSAEDTSILNTTYEGNHNHPLPPAALPMAFATSAATARLLSGSSATSPSDPLSTSAGLQYCFNLAPKTQPNTSLNPNPNLYTTNPTCSIATYNPYYSHPTITIDLTTPSTSTSLPINHAPGSSTSRATHSNYPDNNVELGFQGFEDRFKLHSQPFHLMQEDHRNDVSVCDEEKSNLSTPHEIDLAAAMSSNPSFQSVLADAIASYIANKGRG